MRLAANVRSVGEIELLAFDGEIDFVHDSPAEAESALG